MDNNRYKNILLGLKKEAEEKLEKTQGHIKHVTGPVSKSFDEQVTERSNDEVVYNLDDMIKSELQEIESALSRIEHDKFGVCDKCESDIEPERLETIPYTTICKNCARNLSN